MRERRKGNEKDVYGGRKTSKEKRKEKMGRKVVVESVRGKAGERVGDINDHIMYKIRGGKVIAQAMRSVPFLLSSNASQSESIQVNPFAVKTVGRFFLAGISPSTSDEDLLFSVELSMSNLVCQGFDLE